MPSSNNTSTAEKILRRVKGLRERMQPAEESLLAIPAIWDSGQDQRSNPCEVIVTNQRLLGYYLVTFPRERLFLEDLSLTAITTVSLRHKTFEPLFRELLVSDGQHKIYIRASRIKIETLYTTLRSAIEQSVSSAQPAFADELPPDTPRTAPIYGRQDIRTTFERSPLAMSLLFVGGIALEIVAALVWAATQSTQTGLPLFIAGLVAVLTAIMLRRLRR